MPTETSSPSGGGAANRLGLALQLCALRYLGFVPRNLSAAPRSAACFVADQLEAWRVATAQAPNEKVRLFSRLGRLVLDPDIPDEQLRRRIFEEVASRELFAAAVEETEQLLRPRDGSYLDFVENRYGPLRKFAPLVLRVLDFKSLKTDDPLIDAVEILRELNRKRRRRVPQDGVNIHQREAFSGLERPGEDTRQVLTP